MPYIQDHLNSPFLQLRPEACKDNSDHKDQCSPLCVCNCCQITISSMKFTRLLKTPKVFEPNTSKKIQFKKNTIQNQLYADIWQPPKINIA